MRQRFDARYTLYGVVLALLGAASFSCKESIERTSAIDQTDSLATQIVHQMNAIQKEHGRVRTRLQAPLMENYALLPEPYEIFPQGVKITGYTLEGEPEFEVTAQKAIHKTGGSARWEAYGDVVILNFIKGVRVETDTLYWDQAKKKIYTHAFIKYYDPDGFVQAFGMESDERAENIVVFRPFDSYMIVRDATAQESYPHPDTLDHR